MELHLHLYSFDTGSEVEYLLYDLSKQIGITHVARKLAQECLRWLSVRCRVVLGADLVSVKYEDSSGITGDGCAGSGIGLPSEVALVRIVGISLPFSIPRSTRRGWVCTVAVRRGFFGAPDFLWSSAIDQHSAWSTFTPWSAAIPDEVWTPRGAPKPATQVVSGRWPKSYHRNDLGFLDTHLQILRAEYRLTTFPVMRAVCPTLLGSQISICPW